jgi:hypothetical protein
MEGKFFRDVISQDHFAKMPQKPIYPISFAYYPLDHTQASGSANMSKIDKPVLTVFLTSGLAAGHIIVIARNWVRRFDFTMCLHDTNVVFFFAERAAVYQVRHQRPAVCVCVCVLLCLFALVCSPAFVYVCLCLCVAMLSFSFQSC